MNFQGKAVLVTGATSGIGSATARAFAAAGAGVMLSGRDEGRGGDLRAAIVGAGGTAALIAGDLADPGFCEHLIHATVDRFGRLDVVVNNAGIIHRAPVDETTDAHWREIMAVNVDAVFYLSRAAVPVMRAQARGAIVNVASDVALVGARAMAAYCASKGAVLQLTRAMALDHAGHGIRVNAVCPDEVDTPMLRREAKETGQPFERFIAAAEAEIPLGRIARADEVAAAILFLASDDASFITGAALPVDGGYTAG